MLIESENRQYSSHCSKSLSRVHSKKYKNCSILQSVNGSQNEPSGWPVVMVTGFTVPYLSMIQVRQQVSVHISSYQKLNSNMDNLSLLLLP